jgi:hypothetical protein
MRIILQLADEAVRELIGMLFNQVHQTSSQHEGTSALSNYHVRLQALL